jgi:hypothetical protein
MGTGDTHGACSDTGMVTWDSEKRAREHTTDGSVESGVDCVGAAWIA